ncbi:MULTISPECIES: transposase [unclassified Lentimicrobium]|uniref:transposase n=1 Tax=unclassified Lentimicrobium TaxID=2677434 RepID=UPI001551B86A|nr:MULTISPECIES: transposase [unclassified Lentimicrobium]NPD45651.1 transposase [Lentimicrobium sp. S6]NPD86414.1 transposase [Lentimicrobium sp. L6]
MMPTFKNMSHEQFDKHFSTKEACLAYLSEQKWSEGFVCKKCGHTNSCDGRQAYSRRCTKCKTQESATANTAFHGCKISLPEAFKLAFLVCQKPDISSHEISRIMEIRQMTCWKFKKKITECIDGKGELNVFRKVEFNK